jgi:hypothetical protein
VIQLRKITKAKKEEPVQTAQRIRLGDVFILGPFMIWVASQTKPLPDWARSTLFFSGIGTIIYNLYNYETQQRMIEHRRHHGS